MSNIKELQSQISLLEEKVKNLEKGKFKSITTRRINIIDVDKVDDYHDYDGDDSEYFDTKYMDFGLFMYSNDNDLLYEHGFRRFTKKEDERNDEVDYSVKDEDYNDEESNGKKSNITTHYYHIDDENKVYNNDPRITIDQCSHGGGQFELSNHKGRTMISLSPLRRCHSGRLTVYSGDNDDFNNRFVSISASNHHTHPVSKEEKWTEHGLKVVASRGKDSYKIAKIVLRYDEEDGYDEKARVKLYEEEGDNRSGWLAIAEE